MPINFILAFLESARRLSSPTTKFAKSKFIVLLSFGLCLLELSVPRFVDAVESTPVINTSTGPVRGEVLTTVVRNLKYSSFRNIRFAEAPTGNQRFKPPVPAKPWTEILEATVEPNACSQYNLVTHNYIVSEDCLFLNVFTPLTEFDKQDKKAVMVWIYGGSWISGSTKTAFYGPDFLLEDDVILVTFNYRVGAFGFLGLDHPNATGNAGMKDQVLALRWIKKNIEKFGGNSTRITIFGNSAGGASADLHMLSEQSRGLFQNTISMSGSALNPWAVYTREETVNQSFVLGSMLGIATADKDVLLKSLYEASASDIVNVTEQMGVLHPRFRPTIEDPNVAGDHAFLTEAPLKKYESGNFTKVPHITGFTAQETGFIITPERMTPISNLVSLVIATIENINQSLPLNTPTLENLINTAKDTVKQIPSVTLEEFIQKTSFEHFFAGIDATQRLLYAKSPEPVFYYRVSFNPMKSLHELRYHIFTNGSVHTDDLAYIFYMPIIDLPLDEKDPISITRRRMVRMWTNFAKYGNPTPDGEADPVLNITWPASGSTGIHLEISEELSIGPRPINIED